MLHNNMLKHISGFLLAIAVVPFSLALSSWDAVHHPDNPEPEPKVQRRRLIILRPRALSG